MMGYASYSSGFKAGAFDVRAQAVLLGTGDLPVKPEELDCLRDRLEERVPRPPHETQRHRVLLRLEGPADLRDDPGDRSGLPEPARVDASSARSSSGSSRQATTGRLRLYGAHLDTEVTDVGTLGPDAAIEGAPLPQAPEWTVNAGVFKGIRDRRSTPDAERECALRLRAVGHDERAAEHAGHVAALSSTRPSATSSAPRTATRSRAWGENLTSEKTCFVLGDLDGFTWTNACQPNEGTALYGVSLMARF